jgi:hypothetical protein
VGFAVREPSYERLPAGTGQLGGDAGGCHALASEAACRNRCSADERCTMYEWRSSSSDDDDADADDGERCCLERCTPVVAADCAPSEGAACAFVACAHASDAAAVAAAGAAWQTSEDVAAGGGLAGWTQGSAAFSLCTTTHPLHARSTEIIGTAVSEPTLQPNPLIPVAADRMCNGKCVSFP